MGLLSIALTFGLTGFMLIEGYSFADAFYMTIITISTVGFSEIHELSPEGRLFTSILIISNIGIFFYSISVLTSFILDGDFRKFLKSYRMNKKVEKLYNHVIVCGYGRNGKEVCKALNEDNVPFVIVERQTELVAKIREKTNYMVIEGDAVDDNIFLTLNTKAARGLVTTLPNDADNVFVVLSAKEINPNLNVIARASIDSSETKLKRAGASHVILPEKIGGIHMASIISKPDIMDFLSFITGNEEHDGTKLSLEEFSFDNVNTEYQNKSIKDLDIRNLTGANVIGLKNKMGEFLINPSPDTKIEAHTKLFVLGSKIEIEKFKKLISNN